jgi:hypothetical protein
MCFICIQLVMVVIFCLMFFKLCLQVLVTSYNELDENEFLDPRTAQVAIVDHVKQVGYLKMLKHIFFVCCLFSDVFGSPFII